MNAMNAPAVVTRVGAGVVGGTATQQPGRREAIFLAGQKRVDLGPATWLKLDPAPPPLHVSRLHRSFLPAHLFIGDRNVGWMSSGGGGGGGMGRSVG